MPVLRLAATALTCLVLLVGCGGTTEPNDPGNPDAEVVSLTATIRGGRVEPNAERVEVRKGTRVRITVRSDTPDSLHVHGYDEELEVTPGKPATLEFVADRPGRFEIEFHEAHQLVYQLLVTA